MSYTTAIIPRFLLPRRGQIWRRAVAATVMPGGGGPLPQAAVLVRFASSSSSSKGAAAAGANPKASGPGGSGKRLVLEKPSRFNPPSHGSRLPSGKQRDHAPRHYGGPLSADEARTQAKREYPGTMPPRDTWTHWFLHTKAVHLFITLGTLSGLAVFTWVQNFRKTSPFTDMLPPLSDFAWHPVSSVQTLIHVLQLTGEHNSALVAEKRDRKIDDVLKRRRFRKAHGLEEEEGTIAGWVKAMTSDKEAEGEGEGKAEEAAATAAAGGSVSTGAAIKAAAKDLAAVAVEEGEGGEAPKRKKFLGIF